MNKVISCKEWLSNLINDRAVDVELREWIKQLPEGECLCHGDYHPFNLILTLGGSPIVIDFANICRGPSEYDIARTYF